MTADPASPDRPEADLPPVPGARAARLDLAGSDGTGTPGGAASAGPAMSLTPLTDAPSEAHLQVLRPVARRWGTSASPRPPLTEVPDGSTPAWERWGLARAAAWADPAGAPSPLDQLLGGVVATSNGTRPAERVVLAGDWHGNVPYAGRVMAAAAHAGARLLVQVGDFGVWPGRAGQHYLDCVSDLAAGHGVLVAFLDGNHEDFDQLERAPLHRSGLRALRPWLVHLPRGTRLDLLGLRVGVLGGATSLDRGWRTFGASWWPQEEITAADLDRLAPAPTPGPAGGQTDPDAVPDPDVRLDVLLTHDAPSGVLFPHLDPHAFPAVEVHRAALHRLWLDEALARTAPALLVHGHFHRYHRDQVPVPGGTCTTLGLDCDGHAIDQHAVVLTRWRS